MCWRKSGLFSPPVISISEISLDTLPDTSDESETNVASDDAPPDDEALEMVRNILRDKELSELIFKQFPQPHISSPRAIAKYIDPPEEEIRERDAKSLVAKIASQFTPQVLLEEELQEMSEEPIIHVIPSIPHTEALTSLKSLREYIGEREISQGNVLAELERIEETILRLRQANVRQRPIQDFFAS